MTPPDRPGGLDGPWPGPGEAEEPDGVLDLGLQHERTALAWDRTALGLIVVGALVVRAVRDLGLLWAIPGLLTVGVGGLVLWLGVRQRHRRELLLRAGASPVQPGLVRLVAAGTVGISLVSLVLVVLAGT
jgi:uncharacterized membrane protein YidH (DUF202 family)